MTILRFLCVPLLFSVILGCADQFPPTTPSPSESLTSEIPAETVAPTSPEPGKVPEAVVPAATPVPALEADSADGHNRLTRAQLEDGWLRLFDGHTLFGWTPNSQTEWKIVDGVIIGSGETPGILMTTTRWADYVLKVDFRVVADGNSGIFLRTPLSPKSPVTDCYELNICDSHPEFKSGSLVGRAQPMSAITGNGDWHTFEVTAAGPKLTVKFDGEPILDFTDDAEQPLLSGFIGLQMNGGQAEFRNVFLKPLGTSELFDGKTLTGWRVVPGSQGEFTVVDGTIKAVGGSVANGRGFLETERTAGNFVLQFEAITHGEALNSGVFFRAMPGTESNPSDGYEFQVHSGTKEGDRNQPLDHGSGAIFRRAPARRVMSSDNAWFTATLVADGPHFTTWVDGVQVVDWTDERPADENPRRGLRLEPGHFSLQIHDPTTNLQFRKLRLAELP